MTTELSNAELVDLRGPLLIGHPNEQAVAGWRRAGPSAGPAGDGEPGEPLVLFSAAGNDW